MALDPSLPDVLRRLAAALGAGKPDDALDGHGRWSLYRAAMEEESVHPVLLRATAAEPDAALASAVVGGMLERVGAEDRPLWVQTLEPGSRAFALRRADELAVLEAVRSGRFPEARVRDAICTWSDWLQLRVVDAGATPAVLEALVEKGRTKRIRRLAGEAASRRSS